MRNTLACGALVATLLQGVSGANELSQKERNEGWVLLYDGHSLDGWAIGGKAPWRVAGDGDMLALNGGDDGWILNRGEFKNFIMKCEFKVPMGSDSGIYIRASADGDPRTTAYEIQIHNDDAKYTTGSIVGLAAARPGAPEPDKWHSIEVEARDDHITVKIDGQTLTDARNAKIQAGHIGFQYNKANKVEFRDIKVKPL